MGRWSLHNVIVNNAIQLNSVRRISSFGPIPRRVKIVEVGPRDGLQNEKSVVATETKLELISRLVKAGLPYIEASSFVSKAWVPQMGDAPEVFAGIKKDIKPIFPKVTFSALTPNLKGFESALATGAVDEVAIFAAASDSFSKRNINCTVIESFARFQPLMDAAKANGLRVRGYVSCVLGCPYEGPVHPEAVSFVSASLLEMGCYEVSLGDTIGVGVPTGVRALLTSLLVEHRIPPDALAVHFHSTYGSAVANILAAVEMGIATVDSAIGGLGGCPYAAGASGNVPTEDVVYMLHGMGIETGTDFDALAETGDWITSLLGRKNESRAGAARMAQKRALDKAAAENKEKEAKEKEASSASSGTVNTEASAAAAKPSPSFSSSFSSSSSSSSVASAKPVPLCWPVSWPSGSPAPTVLLERLRLQQAQADAAAAAGAAQSSINSSSPSFSGSASSSTSVGLQQQVEKHSLKMTER